MLLWLLFFAAIVAGIVLLLQALLAPGHRSSESKHHAVEILNERFARGEIDGDEFEVRRKLLTY